MAGVGALAPPRPATTTLTSCSLRLLAAGWYSVMLAISLLGMLVARSRYRRAAPSAPLAPSPPSVSILRPVRGLDCNLFENFESSFVQDYPDDKVEVIFCAAEEGDQALGVAREVMDRHPRIDSKIIVGEERVGVNPKINNLMRAYSSAKHDILWILDSNTLVSPSTLRNSVSLLGSPAGRNAIGLVHHVPFAMLPSDDLGSRIEQAFLNTTHAKMYLAINATGIDSCLMGKSNMFRRSDLERATAKLLQRRGWPAPPAGADAAKDGFRALAAYARFLGEDNMIGHTLWHQLGLRHGMTPDVAGNAVGFMDFKSYFWRRVRWIRVRKYMVTASTLAESFTEAIVLAVLASLSFHRLLHLPYLLTFLLHLVLSFSIDVAVSNSLTASSPSPLRHHAVAHDGPIGLPFLRAWLIREALALPIWLYAMCGDRVAWREGGREYRVTRTGEVVEVGEDQGPGWTERWLARFVPSLGARGYAPVPSSGDA